MDSKPKLESLVTPIIPHKTGGSNKFDSWSHPSPHADEDHDSGPTPFELISKNLSAIGALSIEQFLQAPVEVDMGDITYYLRETREKSATPPPAPPTSAPRLYEVKSDAQPKAQCIAHLHQACQRAFGKTDPLKFEFVEVEGPSTKRCILTITHPNGAVRSYTTPGVYPRKNEAKSQTAALAVDVGAIEFINTGDTNAHRTKNGIVLAPLDAVTEEGIEPEPEDPMVRDIEECCIQWRAGRVKPYWVALNDPKATTKQGCALRIQLSPHSVRAYSTPVVYATLKEARLACAKAAHEQGVIEFIKHGNGLIEPERPAIAAMDANGDLLEAKPRPVYPLSTPVTLQEFYDTFPQPFPESLGGKSVGEFNAPSWLNITIQGTRGAKLAATFSWTTNGQPWGGNVGLHGCLLRLDRPRESRSYLVDAIFIKRADAKAAVCLQAMSQGIGDYIRAVSREVENKVTPTMKRWANELIFPTLTSECGKLRPGMHPRYDFEKDKDAYGCSMTLELSTSPTSEQSKTYSVPTEYRTKADAKIAVACRAAEQGGIEFLRFRGDPVPPYYQTFHSELINGTLDAPNKRKNWSDDGLQDRKRTRTDSVPRSGDRDPPLLETKEEALMRLNGQRSHSSATRPYGSRYDEFRPRSDNGWNKRRGPVSGGLGPTPGPSQVPPMSHAHPGNRDTGARPPRGDSVSAYGVGSGRDGSLSWGRDGSNESLCVDGTVASSAAPTRMDCASLAPRDGLPISDLPDRSLQYRPAHHPQPPVAPRPHQPVLAQISNAHVPPWPQSGMYMPSPSLQHAPPAQTYYPHPGPPSYGFAQQPQAPNLQPGYGPVHPPVNPHFTRPYGNSPTSYSPYPGAHLPYSPSYPPPPNPYNVYQHSANNPYYGTSSPATISSTANGFPPPAADQQYQYPGSIPMRNHPTVKHRSNTTSSSAPHAANVSKSDEGVKEAHDSTPIASERAQPSDEDIQLTVTPVPTMHLTTLLEYCHQRDLPEPLFHDKAVTDASSEASPDKIMHKVWIVMGGEKLELPVSFLHVNEGRERLAKQALKRLRSQEKARLTA